MIQKSRPWQPRGEGGYQRKPSDTKRPRINEEIRTSTVRLIGPGREPLGDCVCLKEAIRRAQEFGLDLVEIAPAADPPVCRIMDYSKYRFERNKQKAGQRKKQKKVHLKEIKFRAVTDKGDYQVKLRNLIRFLEKGDKAKVVVRLRGRERVTQGDLCDKLVERLESDLAAYATADGRPKKEGAQTILMLSPKKVK